MQQETRGSQKQETSEKPHTPHTSPLQFVSHQPLRDSCAKRPKGSRTFQSRPALWGSESLDQSHQPPIACSTPQFRLKCSRGCCQRPAPQPEYPLGIGDLHGMYQKFQTSRVLASVPSPQQPSQDTDDLQHTSHSSVPRFFPTSTPAARRLKRGDFHARGSITDRQPLVLSADKAPILEDSSVSSIGRGSWSKRVEMTLTYYTRVSLHCIRLLIMAQLLCFEVHTTNVNTFQRDHPHLPDALPIGLLISDICD